MYDGRHEGRRKAGRREGGTRRTTDEGRRTTDEGARTTDEGARTRTKSCRGSEIEGQRTAGRTKDYAPGTAPAKDPNLNSTTVSTTVTERLPPPTRGATGRHVASLLPSICHNSEVHRTYTPVTIPTELLPLLWELY